MRTSVTFGFKVVRAHTAGVARCAGAGVVLLGMVAFLLATGLVVGLSPARAEVSDVPDPTVQANGPVFAVLPVGGRIYIGGDFTQVDGVPRSNIAAIDASTGNLTGWNPGANGRVASLAASPDNSRIYAGGTFTQMGGITRNRVAVLDAATGTVDTRWTVAANNTVRALAVAGNRLYLGGSFTTVNSQSRARLAAVDRSTGALDPNWNPSADNQVRALALSPNGSRLYAGGEFSAVSGQARSRIAALDPATGAVDPWRTAVSTNGIVFALAVTGSRVYSAEGGPGGVGAAYDTSTGVRRWRLSGDGDGQAITVLGNRAYIGGHFENFNGRPRSFFAAADATSGVLDGDWDPNGGGGRLSTAHTTGVWTFVPDAVRTRVYAGTNFRQVSGRSQSGFVQFSDPAVASPPNDTVAPAVNGVSPAGGAQDVPVGTDVEALFSEGMDPATMNAGAFTLTREGGVPVDAAVGYDGVTDKATLDPAADLELGRSYTARITSGAKDIAGNALAQSREWSFTTTSQTDTDAPETTITVGPSGAINSSTATFEFSSTEEGSSFRCALDGGAFENCGSPKNYAGLSQGGHTLQVRAVDASGNADATPASRSWSVDTVAPDVDIVTPADGAVYRLDQGVDADYSCREAAGSGLASCQGTVPDGSAVDTSSAGSKTFVVTATDNVGNTASRTHAYSVTGGGQPPAGCTVTGTSANDTLTGTPGPDHICGGGGNDTIRGLGGDDMLKGEGGSDQLYGGEGSDTLDGGLSTDYANFSTSAAAVVASLTTNTASGDGSDVLVGVESLVGSPFDDDLSGASGANTLLGYAGDDTVRGGPDNDSVTGNSGADDLFGDDGNDAVDSRDGVNGNDSLNGGPGTDSRTTDATERSLVGFP